MLLTFTRQLEVPTEIMLLVLNHLTNADLINLSFVCHELARITRLLLFQTITISAQRSDIHRFLYIIRAPHLYRAVERLIWQESLFRNRGWQCEKTPVYDTPRTILWEHLAANAGVLPTSEDQAYSWCQEKPTPEEEADQPSLEEQEKDLNTRIAYLAEHPDCGLADSETCLAALIEGFAKMTRLKTLISRHAREYGSTMDAIISPPVSFDRQHLRPLDDATMRLLDFHDCEEMDRDGGFFCMLAALSITGAPIETLVTERALGLLKQGIPPVSSVPADSTVLHNMQAFKNLRRISLCLDSPASMPGPCFPKCLEAATLLEHLEISVTYNTLPGFLGILTAPLNRDCFMNLRALLLESARFAMDDLVDFLVRRARSLVNVTLWDCSLIGDGSWKSLIQALAEARSVRFESFIVKSPRDADIEARFQDLQVAPRMNSGSILRFINEGGIGINPFAQRRWINLSSDDETVSNASDYSDISGCSFASSWIGHDKNTVDDDPDGPEYNSDYDFDNESDSDTDSAEDQIETGVKSDVKSAEGQFYNNMWSGLNSE